MVLKPGRNLVDVRGSKVRVPLSDPSGGLQPARPELFVIKVLQDDETQVFNPVWRLIPDLAQKLGHADGKIAGLGIESPQQPLYHGRDP